ncbi:hypothetical protein IWX90DRAFT_410828 [Phyllosticta citrichinensis]|uniref:Uncharacterized protein n=1 Tax=Phyllosticta citrichinensis TaxID=1130410 RepID=A0ABR1Y656_9PEZI
MGRYSTALSPSAESNEHGNSSDSSIETEFQHLRKGALAKVREMGPGPSGAIRTRAKTCSSASPFRMPSAWERRHAIMEFEMTRRSVEVQKSRDGRDRKSTKKPRDSLRSGHVHSRWLFPLDAFTTPSVWCADHVQVKRADLQFSSSVPWVPVIYSRCFSHITRVNHALPPAMSPSSAPRNGQTNEVQPLTGRDRPHPASIASENSTLATFFYADQPRIPHKFKDGLIKDAYRSVVPDKWWSGSGTESGQAKPALSGDDTQTTSRDSLSTQTSTSQLVEIIELTDSSDDAMPVHLESDVEESNRIISCRDKGEEAGDTPRSSEMQSGDHHNEQGADDVASRNVNLLTSTIDYSSSLKCSLDRFEKDEDQLAAVAAARAAVAGLGGPFVNPATYGAVYAATISNLRALRKSTQSGSHTVKA